MIQIYTDGATKGNPGPGGYGAIILYGKHQKRISGGFRKTTNNRMELLAVIKAIETLKSTHEIEVISDSKYVVNSINKWVYGWEMSNFTTCKNPDLWRRYVEVSKPHAIQCTWVKGHAGNHFNEIADKLASNAAYNDRENIDVEYEKLIQDDKSN